jgi:hypothetical protein
MDRTDPAGKKLQTGTGCPGGAFFIAFQNIMWKVKGTELSKLAIYAYRPMASARFVERVCDMSRTLPRSRNGGVSGCPGNLATKG